MIRIYYMADDGGGGGDEKKKKSPPEGYQPTTSVQRTNWNNFLDYLQTSGVAGSKDLDATDKNVGLDYLNKYNKEFPDKSIDPSTLPYIQYEQQGLRTGEGFSSITPDQLKVLRKQMSPDFVNQQTPDAGSPFNASLSRSYYPSFKKDGKDYGTDVESYVKDNFKTPEKVPDNDSIPKPDYESTPSRINYLRQWSKRYGDLQGRGDTVLKVNEVPRGASESIKGVVGKAAKEYDIDPSLLYSSFMEEGGSGLFKNKDGTDTRHRKPGDYGYQGFYGDKEFPINGNESLGMPDFANRFSELVSKGYLPKNFESRFRGKKNAGEYSENDFKTLNDGLKAKAAWMKMSYDEVDKYAKDKGIDLSKNAKDFFALAYFNSGDNFKKILKRYNEEGLLKDDKFLKEHPHKDEKIDPKDDVWSHIAPRIKMSQNLKKEQLF